jgi:hypothetical protein
MPIPISTSDIGAFMSFDQTIPLAVVLLAAWVVFVSEHGSAITRAGSATGESHRHCVNSANSIPLTPGDLT